MSLSHIITASRGRLAQLIGGVGNNQFVRASDLNKVIDSVNTVQAGTSVPTLSDTSGYMTSPPYTIAGINHATTDTSAAKLTDTQAAVSKLVAEINALKAALKTAGIIS